MSKYENLCIISDDDIQIIFFYGNIQWNSKSESLKNVFLYIYIFNQDISLKISLKSLKFGVLIASTHIEVTVSHISYLGLSYIFMKSRRIMCKN